MAQDANGLNYFLLPFQASCAMTTGVEVRNGLNHRTYRKSAIAPNLLLQANAERTRGNCIAVDVAAAEGRKCRDLLAESPDKGNAKTQTKPHVQI